MKKYNATNQRQGKTDYKRQGKNNKRRRNEVLGGTRGRFVTLRAGESTDQLIKRFKRVVESSGVLKELRQREYYLSPSQKIREKKKRALKRLRKRLRAMGRYSNED
jgi:small subunit ribosomal protein S21